MILHDVWPKYWRELILVTLLTMTGVTRCASDADAQTVANKPLVLIVEQDAVAYGPGGVRYYLPAGTELDACAQGNDRIGYDIPAFMLLVRNPCKERPLFADGFEGDDAPPRPRAR